MKLQVVAAALVAIVVFSTALPIQRMSRQARIADSNSDSLDYTLWLSLTASLHRMQRLLNVSLPNISVNATNNAAINNAINRLCTLVKADLINDTYDSQNNITDYRTEACRNLTRHLNCSYQENILCQLDCDADDDYRECEGDTCQYSMPQFCMGQIFNVYSIFADSVDTFVRDRKDYLQNTLGSFESS